MSSVVVSGLVLPVSVGGHPALNFCNTRAGWGAPAPKEYLLSYDHLAVWSREVGVFRPSQVAALRRTAMADPVAAQQVLAAALVLREAAYAVLLGSRSASEFSVVAAHASAARGAATLRRSPSGERRWPGGHSRWMASTRRCSALPPNWTICCHLPSQASWPRAPVWGAAGCSPTRGGAVAGATWPYAATGPRPAGMRSAWPPTVPATCRWSGQFVHNERV